MNIVSHIFGGFICLKVLSFFSVEVSVASVLLSGLFSILPDIDGLWSENINLHHQSPFHVPTFWVLISLVVIMISIDIGILLLTMTLFHLLLDYIAARFSGVMLLYPFTVNRFSLFPTDGKAGYSIKKPNKKKIKEAIKEYSRNRILLAAEVITILLGVLCLFSL